MRKQKTESRNQKLAIRNNQKSDYRKSRNWKLPKAESKSFLVFFIIILIVFYGGRYLGYHESREQTRELLSFLPIFRLRKVSFFFSTFKSCGPFLESPDNQCARKAVVVFKQDRGFNSLAFNISHQLGKQNAVVC